MSRFHYTWQYRPGRNNVADPLRRNPLTLATLFLGAVTRGQNKRKLPAVPVPTVPTITPEPDQQPKKKQKKTRNDKRITPDAPEGPEPDAATEQLLTQIARAYTQDPWYLNSKNTASLTKGTDGLYRNAENQIMVPEIKKLRAQLIQEMHATPYSGHAGITKTYENIQRNFMWPQMRQEITEHIRCCFECQRNKPSNQKPAGLLQPLPTPTEPWASVSMDFITQLPATVNGYDAIVVFVCRLTKMAHFVPTYTTLTAVELAYLYIAHIVKLHGLPKEIISDRDSKFTSHFWRALCDIMGTKQGLSTAFHPQTDGQTERVNRVLEEMLRHYISADHTDWHNHLAMAEFAYNNNAYHESTKNTPFWLNYGRHPCTPVTRQVAQSRVPAATQFSERMQQDIKKAKESLAKAKDKQKHYADQKRRDVAYTVGAEVLVSTKNIKLKNPAGVHKLLPCWMGPFVVEKLVGPVAVKLTLPPQFKFHNVFHVSLVKPYRSDGTRHPPMPLVGFDEDDVFQVDMLLDKRISRYRKTEKISYLVKWHGYGP